MAQQGTAAVPPVVVVFNGLADLLPDSYSGDDHSIDVEEFFGRFRQCLGIHQNRFANNADKVGTIKYVLSGTALQWFNDIPQANMPANVNDLQRDMFAKFRIAKTRLQWKKELDSCKYVPGTSTLPMINKFQLICGKLKWPLPVQIEKFVRILPMQLRQFVVSRAHATFAEVTGSVKTFQELIEIDCIAHVFKNVTFRGVNCTLCNESHKSLECPSPRSIIEMEVSSSNTPNIRRSDSRSGSPTCEYYCRCMRYQNRSRSRSRSPGHYDKCYDGQNGPYGNRDTRNRSPYRNSNDRYNNK